MTVWSWIHAAALLLVLPGCLVDLDGGRDDYDRDRDRRRDYVEPLDRGTLIVDWTIDGATDGYDCSDRDAATLTVTVETLSGEFVDEQLENCEEFATSIDLWPDDYVASAVLLDPDGYDRTTAVQIDPFTIYGDDEIRIPIDFPSDSFF